MLQEPVPAGSVVGTTRYRAVPVDQTSRYYAEPLVALANFGVSSEAYYARTDGLNAPYNRSLPGAEADVRVRLEVAKRLTRVNGSLREFGVEVHVLDGFRTLACQASLWEHFVEEGRRLLPEASERTITRYARRYCADPRKFSAADSRTWPTHITGGAVDLTLRRRGSSAELLFMGGVFDDPSSVSASDRFERRSRGVNSLSREQARRNRRLLYWAMVANGFANLSTEWWHYDWGTQLWGLARRSAGDPDASAVYGPAALPS